MSPSTAGFRQGSSAHQRAAQTGFTLVEVLIGIAIAALLSGIVASAFFVTGRSASSSSDSLVSSNSAFRTSARFTDDVAGVGPVADVTSGFVTSGELGCGGSPAVVRLVGPGSPASTVQVRSYEVAGAPTAPTLIRSECTGASLTAALASAAASTEVVPNLATTGGATASCNGEAFTDAECDSVSLSILTESGFSYTLDASVRASRTPTMVTLPNPSPFERTYADNPGSGTFEVTVPAYKNVTFELWGGSGAGGENGTGANARAGDGGFSTYVTGMIPARETTYTLHVALGEGGGRGANGTGGDGGRSDYGSGGKGGARGSDGNNGGNGGGGGGASAMSDSSTYNSGSILIVANGGGGGGGGTNQWRRGGHGQGAIGTDPATRGEISTSAASATLGIKGLNGTGSGAEGGNRGGTIAEGAQTPGGWPMGQAGSGSNGGAGGNALNNSGGGGGGGGGRWGAGGGEGAIQCCGRGNHGGGGGGGGSAIAVGALAPWADWGLSGGVGGTSNSGDRRGEDGKDGKVTLRFS